MQYHMSSVVCSIDSNCLLAHYSLKRITWGLKANPIKKKKKKIGEIESIYKHILPEKCHKHDAPDYCREMV